MNLRQKPTEWIAVGNGLPNSFEQKGIEVAIVESTKARVIVQGGLHLDGYGDYARVDGHHGVLNWYSKTIQLVEDLLIGEGFEANASNAATPLLIQPERS